MKLLIALLTTATAWALSPAGYLDIAPQYLFSGFTPPSGGGGGPTVSSSAFAANLGTNGGTTSSIDTTGDNAIAVIVAFDGASTITVSENKGNGTPTSGNQACSTGSSCNQTFWWTNPTVGSGHTFTVGGSNSFASIAVLPMTGMVTSSLLDVQGAGQSNVANPCNPGSITPSAGNKIVISGLSQSAGSQNNNITAPSGYTSPAGLYVTQTGTAYGLMAAYLIQTPNGSTTNPSWANAGGNNVECTDTAFKGM